MNRIESVSSIYTIGFVFKGKSNDIWVKTSSNKVYLWQQLIWTSCWTFSKPFCKNMITSSVFSSSLTLCDVEQLILTERLKRSHGFLSKKNPKHSWCCLSRNQTNPFVLWSLTKWCPLNLCKGLKVWFWPWAGNLRRRRFTGVTEALKQSWWWWSFSLPPHHRCAINHTSTNDVEKWLSACPELSATYRSSIAPLQRQSKWSDSKKKLLNRNFCFLNYITEIPIS